MSFSIDANVLLYASDSTNSLHEKARAFLASCANGSELVYLTWPVIMAYLRISTHGSIFDNPLSPAEAMGNIQGFLDLPQVRALGEGSGFWKVYQEAAKEVVVRGNLVPDTHIAALLLQHGIKTIWTRDRDFLKFSFLSVRDPFQ